MLNDVIRDRYTQLNREAKRALDIGCTVQFTGKTGKVIRGKVEKINPNSESSPFSRVNIMDVANTLSPFGPRGPPLRALFGVLSLCLAPLAVAEPHGGCYIDPNSLLSPLTSGSLRLSSFFARRKPHGRYRCGVADHLAAGRVQLPGL